FRVLCFGLVASCGFRSTQSTRNAERETRNAELETEAFMSIYFRIRSLISNLLGGNRVERELDAEVNSYLEQLIDQKISEGLDPDAARRLARIELGGVEQVKEQVRDVRAGMLFGQLAQDLRYG